MVAALVAATAAATTAAATKPTAGSWCHSCRHRTRGVALSPENTCGVARTLVGLAPSAAQARHPAATRDPDQSLAPFGVHAPHLPSSAQSTTRRRRPMPHCRRRQTGSNGARPQAQRYARWAAAAAAAVAAAAMALGRQSIHVACAEHPGRRAARVGACQLATRAGVPRADAAKRTQWPWRSKVVRRLVAAAVVAGEARTATPTGGSAKGRALWEPPHSLRACTEWAALQYTSQLAAGARAPVLRGRTPAAASAVAAVLEAAERRSTRVRRIDGQREWLMRRQS